MKNNCIGIEKIDEKISKITLKRPEKHNALNLELMSELAEAVEVLEKSSCSVIILEAEGPTFCSGLDLQEAAADKLIDKMSSHLARLYTVLHHTPIVTIAAVHGNAIAGGGGLAASCDLVLMTETAKIGFPETRRGLVAAQVAVILMRQLNKRHVSELLLTAELIDSRKAVEIGLANRVVTNDSIRDVALNIAQEVLKGAPKAIRDTKKTLNQLETSSFTENLKLAISVHHAARISDEAKEGITAFFEKRSPKWNAS